MFHLYYMYPGNILNTTFSFLHKMATGKFYDYWKGLSKEISVLLQHPSDMNVNVFSSVGELKGCRLYTNINWCWLLDWYINGLTSTVQLGMDLSLSLY